MRVWAAHCFLFKQFPIKVQTAASPGNPGGSAGRACPRPRPPPGTVCICVCVCARMCGSVHGCECMAVSYKRVCSCVARACGQVSVSVNVCMDKFLWARDTVCGHVSCVWTMCVHPCPVSLCESPRTCAPVSRVCSRVCGPVSCVFVCVHARVHPCPVSAAVCPWTSLVPRGLLLPVESCAKASACGRRRPPGQTVSTAHVCGSAGPRGL